jgi:hypothetical protein
MLGPLVASPRRAGCPDSALCSQVLHARLGRVFRAAEGRLRGQDLLADASPTGMMFAVLAGPFSSSAPARAPFPIPSRTGKVHIAGASSVAWAACTRRSSPPRALSPTSLSRCSRSERSPRRRSRSCGSEAPMLEGVFGEQSGYAILAWACWCRASSSPRGSSGRDCAASRGAQGHGRSSSKTRPDAAGTARRRLRSAGIGGQL